MSNLLRRGVAIPQFKEPAASRAIEDIQPTGKILVPLAYGGEEATPAVALYDTVLSGSMLTQPEDGGAPAVATITGVFTGVTPINHPLLGRLTCAQIDCMVAAQEPPAQVRKPADMSAAEVIEAARRANIIDELDGVSLCRKLEDWKESGCDFLAADGTEPEPYASSAWSVLNQRGEQVKAGLQLAARVAGASGCHIAVRLPAKRRRPLIQRLGADSVYQARRRYPVDRLTRADAGVRVGRIGVQACLALLRAAAYEEAHCSCVLTVAGDAVASPRNVRVPFGTPAGAVLAYCGLSADPSYVIFGDAMTGVAASSLQDPILPGITCLLAMRARPAPPLRPCIGCGRCAQVCHAGLLPSEIIRRLENMHYERLVPLHPEECDGCGACSYVCPAGRDVAARVMEAREAHGTIFLNWGDDDDA